MVKTKKYVKMSSSEESDSDDFYEEDPSAEAERKKYSLRQRRGANFAEDFDYEMIEENDDKIATGAEILRSDDEDFDLDKVEKEETKTTSHSIQTNFPNSSNCTITKSREREVEPDIPKDKQSSNDMIDFEDVIRADVLVNRSRIDYDSIIEKTEIKIEKRKPEENEAKPCHAKSPKLKKNGELAKKRGRKPKKEFLEGDDDSYIERKYKKQKIVEESYQSYNAGLPINTVLGVTESLYELAQRYHLQGGIMEDELEPPSIDPILNGSISTEHSKNVLLGGDEVSLKQSETASGTIEIY